MSEVKLLLGDCLELMKDIPDGSIDAIITDPPYGMNKGEWDLEIPNWLHLVGSNPVACFCGVVGMRDYPTPDWIGAWVRSGSTQRNGRLKGFNNWEPILFYNITKLENDVFRYPNYHDETGHPTTKPTDLMKKIITRMSDEGDIILDPFMGSGTTLVAAKQLGRKCVGIELEEKYCEIAVKRLQQEYLAL